MQKSDDSSILCTAGIKDLLHNATAIVDTCVIIDLLNDTKFYLFWCNLVEECHISLFSVEAVKDEFLAAAASVQDYGEMERFIDSLNISFASIRTGRDENIISREFSIALRRCKIKNPSFVDRLLLMIPYRYRNSLDNIFLVTSNHHDVPFEFYDRVAFVARDTGKEFFQTGIYSLNEANFTRMAG